MSFRLSLMRCAVFISALIAPLSAQAGCSDTGQPEQTVVVSSQGNRIARFKPVQGKIETVTLPNGFKLGIQADPATEAKYRELLMRSQGIDELVKIDLFDMSVTPPRPLSSTWGGANSMQGFGPKGGANRVDGMGQQVDLWFHKPLCVTAKSLESR